MLRAHRSQCLLHAGGGLGLGRVTLQDVNALIQQRGRDLFPDGLYQVWFEFDADQATVQPDRFDRRGP